MRVRYRISKAILACLATMLVSPSLAAEELTLQQAVDMAMSGNPTLAAGLLSAEAARHSARGARALSNPELTVAPTVAGSAGSDSAILFSQPLEINGIRGVRGNIAAHQAASMGFDADASRRDILLRVTLSYWDVARAQELVKLNEENAEYLETVRAAVQKQLDVGAVPGAQLLKMDVEIARARQELAQAQLALSQSRAEMNSLLARPSNTSFTVSGVLSFSETPIDRGKLLASALANRPEIASADARLSAAKAEIRAAKLRRAPDLELQARKESFDPDDTSGGIAVAVSLPILDWGSAASERRRAQAAAQSHAKQLEAVRNEIALSVEEAIQRVNTASRVVEEYQGGVIAKSEELATMARKGYEKGANNYLELLEAQRTLRSIRSDYYSALAEHAKALAQLQWAAACSITQTNGSEVKK